MIRLCKYIYSFSTQPNLEQTQNEISGRNKKLISDQSCLAKCLVSVSVLLHEMLDAAHGPIVSLYQMSRLRNCIHHRTVIHHDCATLNVVWDFTSIEHNFSL